MLLLIFLDNSAQFSDYRDSFVSYFLVLTVERAVQDRQNRIHTLFVAVDGVVLLDQLNKGHELRQSGLLELW